MSVADKLLLIRNCTLWSDIAEEEYKNLNVVHNYMEAQKGDYIYFEAYNHKKLYFLKEGHIKIGYINTQGIEIVKDIIGKGDIFGQITLEKNNLNGEFARAYKKDVSLCAFTIEDFQQLLKKKLRHIESRLINLLNKDVKTRLIHFLWQLLQDQTAEKYKEAVASIPNYLTHEDIAHLIGSSRQTVTTLVNELHDEKIIDYTRQAISFPDVKRLQKMIGVGYPTS
jgi:CRP/FNR family transcriptional regulator, cyclic AMP receptor protein